MKVKYNRVSTDSQNISRQNINRGEFDLVIDEVCSGSISFFERKESKKLVNLIRMNKVESITITSIDRIGRNILDILKVVDYLNNNQINLHVENIGINSLIQSKPNPTFKLIISVLGNVAEMERQAILDRQKIGIQIAKLKGNVYKGRLKGTKQTREEFIKKYQVAYNELLEGSTLKRASLLGECSIATAQRLKKLILSE